MKMSSLVACGLLGLPLPAIAQNWTPQVLKVTPADPADTARVKDGRLRKTRYEETNEMGVTKLFSDGKHGLYIEMRSGALGGVQPTHRQQVACTPIELTQGAGGEVSAVANTAQAKFVTDNVGQDYRNGNKPQLVPINDGKNFLLMFNYRPEGTNNTRRYVKVLDASCNFVPVKDAGGTTRKQIIVMQKTNDDCDMHQSGDGPCDIASDAGGVTHMACWAGCNGNGDDDGWLNDLTITCANDAGGVATSCTVKKNFDVSLAQREERSRGRCSIADEDPNTAICTWTEGNTQPQRDGTWIAAVDISSTGEQGEEAQSRVLWKKLIEGQKKMGEARTYSVRANSARVLEVDGQGQLRRTNMLFVNTADLRGNNTDNRKGGRYLGINVGVAQATKDGLTWVIPMSNVTSQMLGIDATHLTVGAGLVQDGAKDVPVITFLQGSQNGGGAVSPDLKVLAADFTTKKFIDYGTHAAGGSYDRHLYSNYLGGNPGNQGRNYAGATFVRNPFVGQGGATAKYLLLHAMTGKDADDAAKPEIKPTSYVSIMPMMNPVDEPPPEPGMPAETIGQNASGGGQNAAPAPGDPEVPGQPVVGQAFDVDETSPPAGCAALGSSRSGAEGVLALGVLWLLVFATRRGRRHDA